MYCDDSRVTQVDPKEVVVSLSCYISCFGLTADSTRVNLLTSYTTKESKHKLYVHISVHIPHLSFLLPSQSQSLPSCCVLFNPCNYTDYA